MSRSDHALYQRAESYAQVRGIVIVGRLGFGLDGVVLETDTRHAVKSFERESAYRMELAVYERLLEDQVTEVLGHAVPQLVNHDDSLQVIEMSIVHPPYILDFAKAQLDARPDFPPEVMAERWEHWADLFESRWPRVAAIMGRLERSHGIYLLDPSPRNIAFADG